MAKHTHEWVPEEDGYYHCSSCPKTKLMSVEDARAFWTSEIEDAKEELAKRSIAMIKKLTDEVMELRARLAAPDKNCITTGDGGCIGTDCMHKEPK